ncbi:MAG: 3,4-dihydroxy-2-butanone-4-phosphate synthase [Thaumarchaeota archaeon]|nr:3,4-dihydroxy-2-butanone-4-phosphate synthase [Nitrososphaerota archaeon]
MELAGALKSLRGGGFVLLHDSEGREDEVDMVAAAGLVTPAHVAAMRTRAGGLVCLALDARMAGRLGLRYMHDMLRSALEGDALGVVMDAAPYGDRPSFSLSVNHRRTYTGITDTDRARTIGEFARLYGSADPRGRFAAEFRAPGHVPLLIANAALLSGRRGHTEMSVYLAQLAGLPPAAAICEMMVSQTHLALTADGARRVSREISAPFVDAGDLLEHAEVHGA